MVVCRLTTKYAVSSFAALAPTTIAIRKFATSWEPIRDKVFRTSCPESSQGRSASSPGPQQLPREFSARSKISGTIVELSQTPGNRGELSRQLLKARRLRSAPLGIFGATVSDSPVASCSPTCCELSKNSVSSALQGAPTSKVVVSLHTAEAAWDCRNCTSCNMSLLIKPLGTRTRAQRSTSPPFARSMALRARMIAAAVPRLLGCCGVHGVGAANIATEGLLKSGGKPRRDQSVRHRHKVSNPCSTVPEASRGWSTSPQNGRQRARSFRSPPILARTQQAWGDVNRSWGRARSSQG